MFLQSEDGRLRAEDVQKSPNFTISVEVTQRLLQIPDRVNFIQLNVGMEGSDGIGSILIWNDEVEKERRVLTKEQETNAILNLVRHLNIPFRRLQDVAVFERPDA